MAAGEPGDPPLKGVRVLELARVLAGPWAGQILADLGADVVKVERPGLGDETREWGPPFVEGAAGETLDAAYYHSCNRGKRSVTADISTDDGRALVTALAARSDILIENFKVGGLARFGLDYGSVRKTNPRLIYCSITGFGQSGPYAPRPGYDFIIQAMSGLMSITGAPEGHPQKVGVAVADLFTGVYSVVAIEAALLHARATGEGQYIDMSLLDTQTSVLANQALNYLVSGVTPGRMGNSHTNLTPYDTFPASDGHLIIAVGNDGQFARLAGALRDDALKADPRFASNRLRLKNREVLHALIAGKTSERRRDELLAALEAAGVPGGPINTIADAFADPQVTARGLRLDLPHTGARGGTVPSVRSPLLLSATPAAYGRGAPRLGEHTDEVRAELGLPPEGGAA
jgi:crotonobetainyl-CoA:carnitine CoA-transferase CaiB-like acyl-CoA transferase